MCLARCSYEGGPATGRGRLARDRRYRGQWRHRRERERGEREKGHWSELAVGSPTDTWQITAISKRSRQAKTAFKLSIDTATAAAATPRSEPATATRLSIPPTLDQFIHKINYTRMSGFKTGYAGSEPRGVWLRTLPSGSGYRHKNTHTTVLPACQLALYVATLVC